MFCCDIVNVDDPGLDGALMTTLEEFKIFSCDEQEVVAAPISLAHACVDGSFQISSLNIIGNIAFVSDSTYFKRFEFEEDVKVERIYFKMIDK